MYSDRYREVKTCANLEPKPTLSSSGTPTSFEKFIRPHKLLNS